MIQSQGLNFRCANFFIKNHGFIKNIAKANSPDYINKTVLLN